MRALITGVTGFAGSFLAEHLLACGDDVLGTSLSAEWANEASDWPARRVPLVAWDLAGGCPDETRRQIEEFAPEAVYHLAAVSHPKDCRSSAEHSAPTEPSDTAIAVNVGGTRDVLALAASLSPRPRLLFVSSSHVYAAVDPARPLVDEAAPRAPRDAYGRTKQWAEDAVREAVRDFRIHAVIARSFKHAGPRQTNQFMLAEWASVLALGESTTPYAPDSRVDLTDVRDVVRAYRMLIERGAQGEAYNVGSGVNRRCGDIFVELWRIALPSQPIPEWRPNGHQEPIADIRRITTEIGWQPEIPLQATLRDTLEYWRCHHRVRSSHSE